MAGSDNAIDPDFIATDGDGESWLCPTEAHAARRIGVSSVGVILIPVLISAGLGAILEIVSRNVRSATFVGSWWGLTAIAGTCVSLVVWLAVAAARDEALLRAHKDTRLAVSSSGRITYGELTVREPGPVKCVLLGTHPDPEGGIAYYTLRVVGREGTTTDLPAPYFCSFCELRTAVVLGRWLGSALRTRLEFPDR